jgi:hypothetical protein
MTATIRAEPRQGTVRPRRRRSSAWGDGNVTGGWLDCGIWCNAGGA